MCFSACFSEGQTVEADNGFAAAHEAEAGNSVAAAKVDETGSNVVATQETEAGNNIGAAQGAEKSNSVKVVQGAEAPNSLPEEQVEEATASDNFDHATSSVSRNRKRARDGLEAQAERMLKRSRVKNVAANPGDNVTVPIPLVDCGGGDPRNILGIVLNRDKNDLYKIAVRHGVLKGKYSRNQFDVCSEKLITESDVNITNEVVLRNAVQLESKCGGQDFLRRDVSRQDVLRQGVLKQDFKTS